MPDFPDSPVVNRGDTVLKAFRGDMRVGLPLHPLEKALVVLASVQLGFLPWAIGGVTLWPQLISLALGAAALVVAACRREYREPYSRDGDYVLFTLPKLWRFPIFWLGLAFFAYIAIQGLNPSHVRMSDQRGWWMEPVDYIHWLPSSMKTDFGGLNPWRVLIIAAAPWLLVCALWIGLTRRSAVMGVVSAVVINGTVLALVGILQKVTHAREILWFLKVPGGYFVSTIIYKNHGGAFFYLMLTLAATLVLWHAQRGSRRLARTSPAPVYGFCAVLLTLIVVLSLSKGAILLTAGFLVTCLLGFLGWLMFDRSSEGNRGTTIMVAAMLLGLAVAGGVFLNAEKSFDRVFTMLSKGDDDTSVRSRQIVNQATWDMARDKLWTGWGAASFQHYFPNYQKNYPALRQSPARGKPLFWRHAHNDYLQALAEYGVIGCLFPAAMLLWWLVKLLRLQVYRRPTILLGLAGLFMIMVHCWIDFQMRNPAILTTWCAGWALLTRWSETEPA